MINRLKYREIDPEKYRRCVENSEYGFFAMPGNLTFLSPDFELLMTGDYDCCMPVPVKKKYGLTFVVMPLFCPMLGIFGKEISAETGDLFLDFLLMNYRVLDYYFHPGNSFTKPITTRKTHILPPTAGKNRIKNYYKGRKAIVKKKSEIYVENLEISDELLCFIVNNIKGLPKKSDVQFLSEYIKFLYKENSLLLRGAFLGGSLLSLAAVIVSGKKNYLLSVVNDEEKISENAASHLVDSLLKDFENTPFDFMGGNIPMIGRFFRSFGAQPVEFAAVSRSRQDLVFDLLRR